MSGVESPDAVLNRAADYLASADDECSMGFDASGVLPADLTLYRVARAVAAPLADLLRVAALDFPQATAHLPSAASQAVAMEYAERLLPEEMAVARAVLGETDGGEDSAVN